jgi:hypothetical protein
MFLRFGAHNEVAQNDNSSQLLFVGQCVLGLPTCTISYKFCGSSPFCVKDLHMPPLLHCPQVEQPFKSSEPP